MRDDEKYIIDLCDEILGANAFRQHRFDFLCGDKGHKLPVDAYYPELNLVIEFHERQHSEAVSFFDKKTTVSGVLRGEQRKIYDQHRRDVLPIHGIKLVEFHVYEFPTSKRRLLRSEKDKEIIISKLDEAITRRSNGFLPAPKTSAGKNRKSKKGQTTA